MRVPRLSLRGIGCPQCRQRTRGGSRVRRGIFAVGEAAAVRVGDGALVAAAIHYPLLQGLRIEGSRAAPVPNRCYSLELLPFIFGSQRMTRRAQNKGEMELKFDLDKPAASVIETHPLLAASEHHIRSQRTTYFDTPNGELKKLGYSLRVRQVGDGFTQTLKTRGSHAGLFDRGEWEMSVAAMRPEAAALARTPAKKLTKEARFLPTIHLEVERTMWLIDHLGSAIEVCLDKGTAANEGGDHQFQELELEMQHGEPAHLFALSRAFLEAVPLRLGVLSKDERGEMLAHGVIRPEGASRLTVDHGMTVGFVFEQIVGSCIRHFRLNEALILANCDPEALHQARIAMRRLRAALAFFRPAIRQSGLWQLRTELRWFTASLADARDVDVFLAQHDDLSPRDREKLQSARASAYAEASAAIDSQRLRGLFLDLVEWLSLVDWQKKSASAPIVTFAASRLDKLWKDVRQSAPDLAELDDHRLHRLRIAIKKLRYAVEYLEALYGKRARKFTSRLEKMQDCLGLMNDEAAGRKLTADLSLSAAKASSVGARTQRLEALQDHFRKLRKVDRFWK